ncbi:unnamed protein product [Prorocentrum cordatum]|uniref:Glycerophosphocholine acyltransferase 1 n=1 Tax=Prorocentrum cordatum TaxID=2364126 RepID=A0ABN9Q6C1_9DINO|nr:unnamed protein product [Polarella glacialis]
MTAIPVSSAAALGAAGTAGAAGLGIFGYNRENYMYDAEFRYERFSAGREFAIEQMDMYREDLRKLSELTAKKCGLYGIFASLGMALCVALYCAGRLGLHGPSPPTHVMGLWLTNNAAAFAYYVVCIWLSTHACYRANSATTQLLTRQARLPVPSLRQLDKARKFASEFEQQDWADIFRIPYLNNPGVAFREEPVSERASSAPPQRNRNKESSWIREEFDTDRAGSVTGPGAKASPAFGAPAPEHFQLYTNVQKHWVQYEVYARVSLLYGYLSFVHSLCYYGLGHINVELRAWWVAYACAFVIGTLLVLLLKFDIVPNEADKRDWYSVTLWMGPAAVLPAAIAMSLDFRVEFSEVAIGFTWFFIFASYIMQLIYTMRLLWILQPERIDPGPDNDPGSSWLPMGWEGWELPTRFQHVLYMVAPPQSLRPWLNDIVREIKEGHVDPVFSHKGKMTKEDVEIQVQYLDSAFKWVQDPVNFDKLSADSKAQVTSQYSIFESKRKEWESAKSREYEALGQTIKDCVSELEGMRSKEPSLAVGPASTADFLDVDASDAEANGHDVQRKAPPLFAQTKHISPPLTVMSLTAVLLFSWFFLIICNIVDCAIGEQATVTNPHWSRPPMTRMSYVPHDLGTPIGFPWPASARPYYPEQMRWHEDTRPSSSTPFDLSAGGPRGEAHPWHGHNFPRERVPGDASPPPRDLCPARPQRRHVACTGPQGGGPRPEGAAAGPGRRGRTRCPPGGGGDLVAGLLRASAAGVWPSWAGRRRRGGRPHGARLRGRRSPRRADGARGGRALPAVGPVAPAAARGGFLGARRPHGRLQRGRPRRVPRAAPSAGRDLGVRARGAGARQAAGGGGRPALRRRRGRAERPGRRAAPARGAPPRERS